VDAWLSGAFDPRYRETLEAALPGAFAGAVRDTDAAFAVEIPSLRGWARGQDDLRRVTQPALSVRGGGSWPGFAETHEALLAWLPRSEGLVVPEATHLLQMADPGAVAEGLAAFLARHQLR
jgi:pimeloyl-ACP methyl ester carboxylesterase